MREQTQLAQSPRSDPWHPKKELCLNKQDEYNVNLHCQLDWIQNILGDWGEHTSADV